MQDASDADQLVGTWLAVRARGRVYTRNVCAPCEVQAFLGVDSKLVHAAQDRLRGLPDVLSEGAAHVRADCIERFERSVTAHLLAAGSTVGHALITPLLWAYRVCSLAGAVWGWQGAVAVLSLILLSVCYLISACAEACGCAKPDPDYYPYYDA